MFRINIYSTSVSDPRVSTRAVACAIPRTVFSVLRVLCAARRQAPDDVRLPPLDDVRLPLDDLHLHLSTTPPCACTRSRRSRVSRVRFAHVVTRCLHTSRVPLTHVARLATHRSHVSCVSITLVARRRLVIINCSCL